MSLDRVKHIVLVLSGKGGVGKSSVTTQLALSLSLLNHSVGILDIDLTGPNIPRFLSVEDQKVTQAPGGWIPVLVHPSDPNRGIGSLRCMSLGFLLRDRGDAVVWRGPKKTAMVRQFLTDVLWGDLDYLLIDTPPGTSDEHISLVETLLKVAKPAVADGGGGRQEAEGEGGGQGGLGEGEGEERGGGRRRREKGQLAGAVVVTTPQAVATADVRKELNFCAKTNVNVLGVLENMSGFVCPNCSECTNVFSSGGGEVMARDFQVPFLGSVPLDPQFVRLVEGGQVPVYPEGTGMRMGMVDGGEDGMEGIEEEEVTEGSSLVQKYQRCSLCPLFKEITRKLTREIEGTE